MFMKLVSFMLFGLLLFFAFGCDGDTAGPNIPEDTERELPPAISAWLEESLPLFMGQSYSYEGKLYILVTYGEKPTGGYSVKITDVKINENRVTVRADFREPGEEEIVTEALTYPFDLVVIEDPGLPVEFIAKGTETYLPTLYGLDYLRPIVAGSQWIKVFTPAPGDEVPFTFSVKGIANVFEGTVNYRLTRAGDTLAEGFTTGMMVDWGYFSFEINLAGSADRGERFLLELYTLSPKDGSMQDLVEIEFSAR